MLTTLGLSFQEIEEFFTGPAYLPFGWMGCMDSWAGPLPAGWLKDHADLQRRILERERSLGMTPVLQGFTGHVPKSLTGHHPSSTFHELTWTGFTNTIMLDPQDPLFQEIGTLFITEQTRLFSTDHLYAADPFIEMEPREGNPTFLAGLARSMLNAMTTVDPDAQWVFQAWPFYFQEDYWTPERVEAFLTAVPDDQLIVLDLWAEHLPLWRQTQAFHGKPWLWCMVHNFGGRQGLHGDIATIASGPAHAGKDPDAGHLSGVGITSETIETNPFVYDLLTDTAWSTEPIDLDIWLPNAVRQRYGSVDPRAQDARQLLRTSVYSREDPSVSTRHKVICQRPNRDRLLDESIDLHIPASEIDAVATALDLLLQIRSSPEQEAALRRDIVDLGHQLVASRTVALYTSMGDALRQGDHDRFATLGARLVCAIEDLDRLAATHHSFLLGRWIDSATRWGRTEADRRHLEKNARLLVTLWSDPGNHLLNDYSGRFWSGLLRNYHAARWRMFLDAAPDTGNIEQDLQNREVVWVHDTTTFATEPSGDTLVIGRELLVRYRDAT